MGGASKFWGINQFGLDVINLGSGAGLHAFCYDDLEGVKGMNWALAPQSLLHDFNILRNYFSYLHKGAFVIIPICPFSCLFSTYDRNHNLKYYTFLHPATIIEFDDSERTRALKIKANPIKEIPIYCFKMTIKEIVYKLVKLLIHPKVSLQESADTMIDGWKRQFCITDFNKSLTEEQLLEQKSRRSTLDEMVSFIKERDFVPVVIVMPMHPFLSSQFPSEFKYNYIDSFLDGIDCIKLDYMYDKTFSKDEYYSTALFLNRYGSSIFTKEVMRQLGISK